MADDQLAICQAAVDELYMALRVCCPEGTILGGEHLLAWRLLPERERRYFVALVAPASIQDIERRTVPREGGGWTYDPPYPEPCACDAPYLPDYNRDTVRCVRCLHVWGRHSALYLAPDKMGGNKVAARSPLAITISRKDIGFALERMQ